MAQLDNPILVNDKNKLDEPILSTVHTSSPAAENEEIKDQKLMQAAIIKGEEAGGANYMQTFLDLKNNSVNGGITGEETRQAAVGEALQDLVNANREFSAGIILENPDIDEASLLEDHQQQETDLVTEMERTDAPYQVLTRQLQDPTVVDEETRHALAVRAELAGKAADLISDMDLWDWTRDMLLELVPTKFFTDTIQATDSFVPWEWGERLEELVDKHAAMTPDEQLDAVPLLMEEMKEAGLPDFKIAQVVTAIVDPATKDEFVFWNGPMAMIDAAATAASILTIANKMRSASNLVRLASDLGDKRTAARISNTSLVDDSGDAAKITGISRETAVNNSTPLNMEAIDPAADNLLAAEVAKGVREFRNLAGEKLGQLQEGTLFIPEGSVAESNLPAAIQRIDQLFFDRVQKGLTQGEQIVDVKAIQPQVGARKIDYRFKVQNADGTVSDETFTRSFLRDDNGTWESLPNPTKLSELLISPKGRAAGGFERVVKGKAAETDFLEAANAANRLDFVDAVIRKELSDLLIQAVKPIAGLKLNFVKRKKEIEQVSEILTWGDDNQHVFTVGELRSGALGHNLNDAQIATYLNIREVMDGIAAVRNTAAYNHLLERGARTLFSKGEALGFGVPLENAAQAKNRVERSQITMALDTQSGRSIPLDAQNWDALYASGHRLVQLEDDVLRNGQLHGHAIAHIDSIRDLPRQVLHLKTGYVPRLNPKGAHFVQALVWTTRDGVAFQSRKAIRGFDNKRDATVWSKKFEAEVRAGKTDFPPSQNKTTIAINEDGELEQFRVGASDVGGSQGLIYSPRRENTLPFGLPEEGLETPRTGAFEAIGLYLENTKNFISRNEWRMAMRTKWENTARKWVGDHTLTWDNPRGAASNKQLMEAKEQLEQWFGFAAPSEKWFDQMVQRLYEVSVNIGGREKGAAISEALHKMKHKSGINAIKTGTFHALLGAWNPVQMIVQGSGAAVALSQGMLKAPEHFFKQNGLFMTMFLNRAKHPEAYARTAKAFGWKPQTLAKYDDLFKRTGLHQSTFTSADIEAAQQGFGMTAGAFRKTINSSTMFFRNGELFNRRLAFMQAIDELGGIDKVTDSLQLQRQMMTRVGDLTLNLGRANRAWWQKGVFSIPTQFLQIQTKTLETYAGLNGAFTPAQRFKLFMTQFMLYGATAVPFGMWLNRQYLDATGWTRADVDDPENRWKLAAANGGMTDLMIQTGLGIDGTIAPRVSLMNNLDQAMMSFFEKKSALFDIAGGPTAGVAKRIWDKFTVMKPSFAYDLTPDFEKEVTPDRVLRALEFFAEDLGELMVSPLSTTTQYSKYRQMTNMNRIFNRKNDLISEGPTTSEDDFNKQTQIATLLGIKPLAEDNAWSLMLINESVDEEIEHHVNLRLYQHMKMLNEWTAADKEGRVVDQATIDRHQEVMNIMRASISNEFIGKEVDRAFRRKLEQFETGNDKLSRARNEMWNRYLKSISDDAMSVNQKLVPTR
jgi:hypothetical protein